MEQELPKPLVSDDQIIQEEEAWNGSIDGGLKEKLASTYTARWVRDIYESELQRLRAQVEAMRVAGNNMQSFILDLQQRGTWGVTSLYEKRSDKLMSAWTASLNPTPTTEPK